MRLQVRFQLEREATLPVDHQHELQGLVYGLLAASDPDYARFLHEEGYASAEDAGRRFKLFVYSGLRAARFRRHIAGGTLHLTPGPVDWYLSSPRDDFLQHSATGILSAGTEKSVGAAQLRVEWVEALPTPEFAEETAFTCLTAIVASVPQSDGRTYYLRPADGEAFSEAVRQNVLRKYRLLHGEPPSDERLRLVFDADYLADPKHRGGTKLVSFKNNIQIVGAFAPFTLFGSPELMQTAWDCGFGEKSSAGFGMIELASRGK